MSKKVSFRSKFFENKLLPIEYFTGGQQSLENVVPVRDLDYDYLAEAQLLVKSEPITVPAIELVKDYEDLYPVQYENKPVKRIHGVFDLKSSYPDYDVDSEDEAWIQAQSDYLNLDVLTFEMIIDKLDKESVERIITLFEAKQILNFSDEILTDVYDYWLHKRLKQHQSLTVSKQNQKLAGKKFHFNPYLAFVQRLEKRQLRKNRRVDELAYMDMLKVKQDLTKVAKLLDLVRKREEIKLRKVELAGRIMLKRYEMKDFSGNTYFELLNGITVVKLNNSRPIDCCSYQVPRPLRLVFNSKPSNKRTNSNGCGLKVLPGSLKEQELRFKKRKNTLAICDKKEESSDTYRIGQDENHNYVNKGCNENPNYFSLYQFDPKIGCQYLKPITSNDGAWPFQQQSNTYPCRRIGRGGRIIIDRSSAFNEKICTTLNHTV